MRGRFRTNRGLLPNQMTLAGAAEFAKMILRADDSLIGPGGDFWVGCTNVAPDPELTLAAVMAGEPTIGVAGYRRIPLTRDSLGWPDLSTVNNEVFMSSAPYSFTGSGDGYDRAVSRMFLCSSEDDDSGVLFNLSAALPAPFVVGPGTPWTATYDLFLY